MRQSDWSLMDYYNAIPSKFLEITLDTARQGHKRAKVIVDEKNYYMFLPADDGFNTQMAVFLRPNALGLVGVVDTHCGPRCFQGVYFLEYQNGTWVDSKDTVFPEPSYEEVLAAFKKAEPDEASSVLEDPHNLFEPVLVLPRQGTTLQLINNWTGVTLMKWRWTGERFESI